MHLRLVRDPPARAGRAMPTLATYVSCRMVPLTIELLLMSLEMSDDAEIRALKADESSVYLQPGLSFAIMNGGLLVASLGVIPVRAGLALGWMIPSPMADRRDMAYVTRRTVAQLDVWQQEPRFRRIEFHVRADQPWRTSFTRRLGVTEAWGPMRAWDRTGRDYWLYARVA